jgi:hypothetical protein
MSEQFVVGYLWGLGTATFLWFAVALYKAIRRK